MRGVLLSHTQRCDGPPREIVLVEPSWRVTFCFHGEVENPGICSLDERGPGIEDGIEAAGGFTSHADDGGMGLCADLHSGHLTHVPSCGDMPHRANINSAGTWLVEALTGSGPTPAERITNYRDRNRRFATTDELVMVEGIGKATAVPRASMLWLGSPMFRGSPAKGT